MNITIIQVGETPVPMRDRYQRYAPLFQDLFSAAGAGFTFETAFVLDGAPFPDPVGLDGIIITGSAAGVYEDHAWLAPLRTFIQEAYAAKTPLLGICFGHQIMADALGGEVKKSDKGWGLGRHVYKLKPDTPHFSGLGPEIAIAASHQDQVITPPKIATAFLASTFTPNAGLIYENARAMSLQPHPEFDQGFSKALIDMRRNNPLTADQADKAAATLEAPLDSPAVAKALAKFFKNA